MQLNHQTLKSFCANARARFFLLTISLLSFIAAGAAEPDVEWAASVKMDAGNKGNILVEATVLPGYHFYSFAPDGGFNSLELEVTPQDGVKILGTPKASVAPTKHFEEVSKEELSWWDSNVNFTIPFEITDGKDHRIIITARWQACKGNACHAPAKKRMQVIARSNAAAAPAETAKAETPAVEQIPASNDAAEAKAEQVVDNVAETIAEVADSAAVEAVEAAPETPAVTADASLRSKWWAPVDTESPTGDRSPWSILIIGFIGGLAALLTPCVWPLIPMTLSFFLKKTKGKKKVNMDAINYGLSIVVIYLVLGIAITLIFGAGKLNELSTSAVFNIIFFVILVVFAISFLGAFDIKLPEKWSNAMDSRAEKTSGLVSVFFMAFTLVLVSFSCTGPIIGTLLVEAASNGNILGPALGMGGFALGLALPFTLCAFFPSMLKSMPKSGGWLNSVKVVLGFIELILSLKFLSVADMAYGWRILDREVFISLWVVLFILLGMYLLGKLTFSHDSKIEKIGVGRFMLALFPLSFAVYLIPGLWGAPLKAVSAFVPPLTTQDFNLYTHANEYHHFDDYDLGMQYALEHNMPVMVDFSGYGCVNCRNMEVEVLDTEEVRAVLAENFVVITLMVDDKARLAEPVEMTGDKGETVLVETVGEKWTFLQNNKFGASSQPYLIVLDNEGKPMNNPVFYDNSVPRFLLWLNEGLENYNK